MSSPPHAHVGYQVGVPQPLADATAHRVSHLSQCVVRVVVVPDPDTTALRKVERVAVYQPVPLPGAGGILAWATPAKQPTSMASVVSQLTLRSNSRVFSSRRIRPQQQRRGGRQPHPNLMATPVNAFFSVRAAVANKVEPGVAAVGVHPEIAHAHFLATANAIHSDRVGDGEFVWPRSER